MIKNKRRFWRQQKIKPFLYIRPADILVIALAAALTLFILGRAYSGSSLPSRVIIRGPDNTWIYPLNTELELIVAGTMGETRVRLQSGRAMIVSSPCAGQTCVAVGSLNRNGQWNACLPNRVFLLIEGGEDHSDVDALVW